MTSGYGPGSDAELYATDPLRPLFHYAPARGWINDPNGLIHWRGKHHLFCQFHPYAAEWAAMYWAHAVGDDPVRWRDLPIALSPPPAADPADRSGIFSGSAVDDDGVLTLVYTIFTDTSVHPGAAEETIGIATSTDGVTFTPSPRPVVAGPPPGCSGGFRDPKVFGSPGAWSMVVGSGSGVQLFGSPDLRSWAYLGVCFGGDGAMWECPDLFPMGPDWVLLVSAPGRVLWWVGAFDGAVFTPRTSGVLDDGPDFYAAQHYRDAAGRDLVIGWMGRWGAPDPTVAAGWAGALSVTRELFVRPDGVLGSRPVAELASLRLPGPVSAGDALDIELVVDGDFRLAVRESATEATVVSYAGGLLSLDTRRSGTVPGDVFSVRVPAGPLRVLVDRSSIEVFTVGGAALTARIYPKPASTGVSLTGSVVSSSVHALGSAGIFAP